MLRDSFDFDTLYNRRLPGDIKYQIDKEHKDVIPMWIADMDFKSPDAVRIALENAVKHGIWGYMHRPKPSILQDYRRSLNLA